MKYLFVFFIGIMCMFVAHADNNNTVTSKDYVDSQIQTLQDEIPAINSNTVLTHTGTSGEIGSKNIYDTNSDYASQQNALVTADTFNTAIQNAIDNEFVCIDWLGEHVPGNCLLWQIRAVAPRKNLLDPATIHQGTIRGADGTVESATKRCYFDYIPVHTGDTVIFTAKSGTPPVYHAMWLYSEPNEETWKVNLGGSSVTIGDHVGYRFTINQDGYIRGLFLSNEYNFTPDDIVEPMLEIATTPSPYEPYQPIYLPNND